MLNQNSSQLIGALSSLTNISYILHTHFTNLPSSFSSSTLLQSLLSRIERVDEIHHHLIITDLTTNLKAEIMNHDLTSDLGIRNIKINSMARNQIELRIGYQNKHNYQLLNRSSEISAAKIRLTP
ncbi:hypothetical protein F2Q68_00037940 [Brassica cretica]|uniref:Uncharacterized protein n=2 Tax=Brassica cretica TaxID=69181 RepID=A0A8S9H252_BRACR|nr:hypothetical protein F2Q68_00037940 [Brassica cretica]KAF3595423.1 hypothetical protein DY000_02028010 [Brassica cretica]